MILLALILRIYGIDRLPGVNGDEAWYGVAALEFLDGRRFGMVTPNGNRLGALQFSELALLHLFLEPSVTVLRIPSLLSSIGAIALAFLAGQRMGGGATAGLAALVMAVLPINIAYARLGWDPSHSGLLVLLATCLLLGGSRLASAIVFAGSLLVHPTNLFAAPFLVLVCAGQSFQQANEGRVKTIGIYAAMLLAGVAVYHLTRVTSDALVNPGAIARRLIDPWQYAEFLQRFGDLLTGETVYRNLAGKSIDAMAPPLAWLTAALIAFLLLRALDFRRLDLKQGVLLGWIASLAAFFALAGPEAISPGFERYGFVLIAPTALATAVVMASWVGRAWFRWLAGGLGAAMLAGFLLLFILPLSNGTDGAHRSYRTGPTDPKVAAAAALNSFTADRPIEVLPEDYWLYLPADYLLHGRSVRLRWRRDEPALDASGAPNSYWLVWSGSETERRVRLADKHRLVWASQGVPERQVRIWQPK